MEVILLEKIDNLGELGEKVTVKSGYGRNYLFPHKKAIPATQDNVENFEARRYELQLREDEKLAAAQERADKIALMDITMTANAGEEGKLYGSIGTRDIAEVVSQQGVEIAKSEVRMPHGPLRELGEYEIDIHLHSEVNVVLKLGVVPE
ncbi:MAG: 50S ribosomal protein L9 [Pseudomonadales bacterium]|jgi:large subunit ribosomal protein L9|nr:50S ribosomal protein L9 [Pseudomonadales bacterium]MDP7596687.1 50S ribosomal protein L9 [Pseudomonadales bacterium]HJN50940.1 50S ribosomal protein L9 [Pseudomonadales bacterium]|tara:strand:+ start:478 stop:924 length:447 start_codon:yes stop_codon:yes gene_type:complete